MSRWKRSSSSRSCSSAGRRSSARRRRPSRVSSSMAISASGGGENGVHRTGEAPPERRLRGELLAAFLGDAVELCAAVVLGDAPFRGDPPAIFQAMEGGVEGALVDLEHVARDLLDALSHAPSVHRLEGERLEDE